MSEFEKILIGQPNFGIQVKPPHWSAQSTQDNAKAATFFLFSANSASPARDMLLEV